MEYILKKPLALLPAGSKVIVTSGHIFSILMGENSECGGAIKILFHDKHQLGEFLKEFCEAVRWKPKMGQEFFVVRSNGNIVMQKWGDYTLQRRWYSEGNCFCTREEAESAHKKVRELLLSL